MKVCLFKVFTCEDLSIWGSLLRHRCCAGGAGVEVPGGIKSAGRHTLVQSEKSNDKDKKRIFWKYV